MKIKELRDNLVNIAPLESPAAWRRLGEVWLAGLNWLKPNLLTGFIRCLSVRLLWCVLVVLSLAAPGHAAPVEICTNGIDDDQDYAIDEEDNECYSQGKIYYISSSIGNDSWSGKNPIWNGTDGPWATKGKIGTGSVLTPGDKVLFKRGDVWLNDLGNRLRKTGAVEKPIYFGGYGTGDKPTIYASPSTSVATFYVNNYSQPMVGLIFDGFRLIGPNASWGFFLTGDDAGGYSDHITVMNSEITKYGIAIHSGAKNVKILNNKLYENNGFGVLGGGENVIIANNIVHDNGFGCGRTPTIYCHNLYVGDKNVEIYNNTIYNGSNYGIIFHGNDDDIYIHDNDIFGNNNAIAIDNGYSEGESFSNILIERNKIHDHLNGWTLSLGSVRNYTFRNNIVYNNPNGYINLRDPGTGDVVTNGAYIYGNTFYDLSSLFQGYTQINNVVVRNNIIVCNSGNSCQGRLPSLTNYSNNTFLSKAEADAYFADAGVGDFHLKQTALGAIDRGSDLSDLSSYGADPLTTFEDFDRNVRPQGPGFDIGAYEYVAEGAIRYGDVNDDAEVTSYDAALTAKIAVGLADTDIRFPERAEVDALPEVTSYDAALIAQFSVGLITRFPVEG